MTNQIQRVLSKWFLFLYTQRGNEPSITSMIGEGAVHVEGRRIEKERINIPIGGLWANKMLFDTKETVYLMATCPNKRGETLELKIKKVNEVVDTGKLRLDDLGCGLYSLMNLLEGDYTVKVEGLNVSTNFTVARYQLVPLRAVLIDKKMINGGNRLEISASLSTFGTAVNGEVQVELLQGKKRRQSLKTKAYNGIISSIFNLPPGEEALTVNYLFGDKSASLPVRGGKESERNPFIANPLGKVVQVSTLPPGKEARGLFFTPGPMNTEPFSVREVISKTCDIEIKSDRVKAAVIVMVNPATGEITKELSLEQPVMGDRVTIPTPHPYGMALIGAIIDNKPYEAYAMAVQPSRLKVELEVPGKLVPDSNAHVTIRTNQPEKDVNVFLTINDGRAVVSDTLVSSTAANIKKGWETLVEGMNPGEPRNRMYDNDDDFPEIYFSRPSHVRAAQRIMTERASFPRAVRARWCLDSEISADLVSYSEENNLAEMELSLPGTSAEENLIIQKDGNDVIAPTLKKAATSDPLNGNVPPPPAPRERLSETVLCRLIRVKGERKINFQAPHNITTLCVMAQAVSGIDFALAKSEMVVAKPIYAEFNVPPFVHAGDKAAGKAHVGCERGIFSIELRRDGKMVPLFEENRPVSRDQIVSKREANFTFDLVPGNYEILASDPEGNQDASKVTVTEPGKIRYKAKTLHVLKPGERIAVTDDPSIAVLKVLPGIEKPFKTAIRETADYGHLCCEQTAAKIVAASLFYSGANGDGRAKAEAAILFGIERERTMYVPGKGFNMYPGNGGINPYYSALAARYLLSSLKPLATFPSIGSKLKDACEEGIAMAVDVAKAHNIMIPPQKITSCRDAYDGMLNGASSRLKKEALGFVLRKLQAEGEYFFVKDSSAVNARAETAFAAGTLFLSGTTHLPTAIRAANWVMCQMGREGAWYSTVDSIAGLSMMSTMTNVDGIIDKPNGRSKVLINGEPAKLKDAAFLMEEARSIEIPEGYQGVALVQVLRYQEEDWGRFLSGIRIEVGLKENGNWVSQVNVGDLLEMVVRNKNGYKPGDICFVCLPPCLSFVYGGGQVKMMSMDFEGKDQLKIPIAATSVTKGKQHFAVVVKNMFEEERGGNPGMQTIIVRGE